MPAQDPICRACFWSSRPGDWLLSNFITIARISGASRDWSNMFTAQWLSDHEERANGDLIFDEERGDC